MLFSFAGEESGCCFYAPHTSLSLSRVVKLFRWCQQKSFLGNLILFTGDGKRRLYVSDVATFHRFTLPFFLLARSRMFGSLARAPWERRRIIKRHLLGARGWRENKWNLWKWYEIIQLFFVFLASRRYHKNKIVISWEAIFTILFRFFSFWCVNENEIRGGKSRIYFDCTKNIPELAVTHRFPLSYQAINNKWVFGISSMGGRSEAHRKYAIS